MRRPISAAPSVASGSVTASTRSAEALKRPRASDVTTTADVITQNPCSRGSRSRSPIQDSQVPLGGLGPALGDVSAQGIASEVVARHCEGSRARAAAEILELARSALAAQTLGIAKRDEHRMLPVDLDRIRLPHVSTRLREKSAGKHLARV